MTDHRDSENTPAESLAPLALDNESLRLPQQLNPGKAGLPDDELIQSFDEIEHRLKHFTHASSAEDAKSLARAMKKIIGKLNADADIPLSFRLKVLHCFEHELDMFDVEMTAAVLNAHKVAIMQVKQAASTDNNCFPVLLRMINNAIEIIIKRLLATLQQYRTPSIIITRHFFDLARLGLDASAAMGNASASETARLNKLVCNHEMLRKLNFFGKTHSLQKMIWQELQHHISVLEPRLYRRGDSPGDLHNNSLMFINLNKPNDPGRIVDKLPEPLEADCIIIPLDVFIKRLNYEFQKAESILSNQQMQTKVLHTETVLENSLIGCKAILDALKTENRAPRHTRAGIKVQLVMDPTKAILKAFTPTKKINKQTPAKPETFNQASAWNVVDFNQYGICLERMRAEPMAELPDSLVGLNWYFGDDRLELAFMARKDGTERHVHAAPGLGFIRWARESRNGEQRIGIEFFDSDYKLAKASLARGQREIDHQYVLPILVRPGKSLHTVIFPATRVYKDMTFMISQDDQYAHFKVREITVTGQNYTQCEIVRAKAQKKQL
ncbi:MAG: hypothetical protein Q9M12_01405 [Mariprofundus sp.]|nr:hypothetical protein [Mariprofundus sp.]